MVEIDTVTPHNTILIDSRYDSTTGTFTVPPGGDGFYYFSMYLLVDEGERADFDIEINGDIFCTTFGDQQNTPGDDGQVSCSAAAYVVAGLLLYFVKSILSQT